MEFLSTFRKHSMPLTMKLLVKLLFLYINHLQRVFSKSVADHFEDDTNHLFPDKKLGTIESAINHELKHLVQWF